jgi:hypothetical protein
MEKKSTSRASNSATAAAGIDHRADAQPRQARTDAARASPLAASASSARAWRTSSGDETMGSITRTSPSRATRSTRGAAGRSTSGCEAPAQRADAERGVALGRRAARRGLVGPEVERAHRQAPGPHALEGRPVGREVLLLVRHGPRRVEQELGAEQPDALGPALRRRRHLERELDVGEQRDGVAVERLGGEVALLEQRALACVVLTRAPLGLRADAGVGLHDDRARRAVHPHLGARRDRRHDAADAHDAREPERLRDDRGVARRAAVLEHEARHAAPRERRALRRRQVLGDDDDGRAAVARRRRRGRGHPRQRAEQPLLDIEHVLPALREHRVRDLREAVEVPPHDRLDGVLRRRAAPHRLLELALDGLEESGAPRIAPTFGSTRAPLRVTSHAAPRSPRAEPATSSATSSGAIARRCVAANDGLVDRAPAAAVRDRMP